MKKIFVIILIAALFFPAIANGAAVKVIKYDNSGITVELNIDTLIVNPPVQDGKSKENEIRIPGFELARYEGQPVLPVRRYLFEVTSVDGVRVEIIDTNKRILEGIKPFNFHSGKSADKDRPEKLSEFVQNDIFSKFVTVAEVGVFRKSPIALVDVRPVIVDIENGALSYASRIVFRLTFPKAEFLLREEGVEMARDRFIVNAEQAGKWREKQFDTQKARVSPFQFSLSDNWVKIRVNSTGIYSITYSNLLDSGINPLAIDPLTIRLFSAPIYPQTSNPFQQPPNINYGGSFETDYNMVEHAVKFNGDQSGSFDQGESVIFYGVGVDGWSDYIEPEADRWKTYDNIYESRNVYWMTWGGTGDSKRMDSADVTPSFNDPPDMQLNTYKKRLHIEQDNEYAPFSSSDRWCWKELAPNISVSYTDYFSVSDIAGPECTVKTVALINSSISASSCYLNSENVGELNWHGFATPDTLVSGASSLRNGQNSLTYQKSDIRIDMYIYWYELFFERYLKPDPPGSTLDFFAPETSSTARFVLSGFPDENCYLFDVSDYYNPVIMTGVYKNADTLIFDDDFNDSSNHYYAVSESGLKTAAIEYFRNIPSLREEASSPSMLVIYNDLFKQSAQAFASYRSAHFPEDGSGYVKAVDIEDVYDNFSGGLKDPMAIRNYLKFLYDNYSENGEPIIEYAFLIGKGNYDPKNIMGRGEDFIPYYFDGDIECDDFLVKLDDSGDLLVDIATGRLPVLDSNKANSFVQKLFGYEGEDNLGSWRNKVLFLADDEISFNSDTDIAHMRDTEGISTELASRQDYLNIKEIYIHDYPTVNSLKPAATAELVKEWNEGALVINYIGHGSSVQLADELLMKKSDIYSLNKNNRLPLFLIFSCSVGDLDQIFTTSLAQDIVLAEGKGAIASIAAVSLSYGNRNRDLDLYFIENLFPSEISLGTETVGRALLFAKMTEVSDEWNNKLYALIGDPSMNLALPDYRVEHVVDDIDTLETGRSYSVSGSVVVDGALYSGFNGTVEVVVQEAKKEYSLLGVYYDHPGSVLFRGMTDVASGEFNANFVVPLRCQFGPGATISSYVSYNSQDGAGVCDTLVIMQGDSVMDNDGPPDINMYFENNATKVKKGSRLVVEMEDKNGIAITGSDPQNSIFLEFDDNGYPIYVTDYFQYDYGSYTSGVVEYALNSEFETGNHSVVVRVFDNLGVMSRDTLDFEIIEEGIYSISDIFNFPNPFRENTNFVFQLTGGAVVHLRVFTVSGIEIWGKELACGEGFNSISWDGRDYSGNRLGNGTYLYMLDAEFNDSFNRSEFAEGKVILMR